MIKLPAQAGQRLDQMVYAYYGTLDYFEAVLKVNGHLLEKLILEAGDEVYLPQLDPTVDPSPLDALWD